MPAATSGPDAIGVPYLDWEDRERMLREATLSAKLGFTGKDAVHPKPVPYINVTFTPDAASVEYACQVIEAFEQCGGGLLFFKAS